MDQNEQTCEFFGARTPEKQATTRRCKQCLVDTPDLFNECARETAKLLDVSIILDTDGNSVRVSNFVMPRVIRREKPVEIKASKRRDKHQEKKMNDEVMQTAAQGPIPKQVAKTKPWTTAGVLNIAKRMLFESKSTEEIMSALIAEYQRGGKDAKQAKHNAQSCLFNARKKLKKELDGAGKASAPTITPEELVPDKVNTPQAVEVIGQPPTGATIVDDTEVEQPSDGSYDDSNPTVTES